MPKNQYTSREELVCGKLEKLHELVSPFTPEIADLFESIFYDVNRMEAKLAVRKDEVKELRDRLKMVSTDVGR